MLILQWTQPADMDKRTYDEASEKFSENMKAVLEGSEYGSLSNVQMVSISIYCIFQSISLLVIINRNWFICKPLEKNNPKHWLSNKV